LGLVLQEEPKLVGRRSSGKEVKGVDQMVVDWVELTKVINSWLVIVLQQEDFFQITIASGLGKMFGGAE
jgi:hypothetical protein